jgi:hypothetical protein
MPDLDSFILEKAPLHHGRFSGNPSQKLRDPRPMADDEDEEEYEEEDEEDSEVPIERRLTELERLAWAVDCIDNRCCITPRGSLYMDAFGNIRTNPGFAGLSIAEAADLANYQLLRAPEQERTLARIHRAGAANNVDFLDCVAEEGVQGAWALQQDRAGTTVTVRSLAWPGFEFRLHTEQGVGAWTRCYAGNGEPNRDLSFMI